jgi:hypothetical protein
VRLRAWMVAAAIAGLMTAVAPFVPDAWGESSLASIVGVPLGFGLILASAPFGGPHNAPLAAPLVILATAINAAFWGFVFWLPSRVRRRRD